MDWPGFPSQRITITVLSVEKLILGELQSVLPA
jgi:hypothetical protein